MDIRHINVKEIIVKSNLPDADFVINPYKGCYFACRYCYACFMARFDGYNTMDWGNYVCVKKNAKEVMIHQLKNFEKYKFKSLLIGSVTDPYQPIEKNEQITHSLLEILASENPFSRIEILTKSPLILTDLQLLKQIKNLSVGITVTASPSMNVVLKNIENRAPSNNARIDSIKKLIANKIDTYAFVGPLIPLGESYLNEIGALLKLLSEIGVKRIFIENLNIKGQLKKRLQGYVPQKILDKNYLSLINNELEPFIEQFIQQYGFELRQGEILNHGEK